MSEWIDTHAHLDGVGNGDRVGESLQRAAAEGVSRVLAVGGAPAGNGFAVKAAERFPNVWAAVGFDRGCATLADLDFSELESLAAHPRVRALGEIGLDFHHEPQTSEAQELLFRRMLSMALDRQLPVIVHCREAESRMLPMLAEHAGNWKGPSDRIGVIHCFTGSAEFARRALDLGFHLSFSGILTFPKADNVRAVAVLTPPDRLLVETDCPYLTPAPHRGKPNEPMHVRLVADCLARVKGMKPDQMAAVTSANAVRLFALN